MSIDRIKRVNELIRRELAMGLFHIGQGEDVDVGKISIVDVAVARDLRGAAVNVSIMGTDAEAAVLMTWLRRHRVDFQAHIAKTVALKYTPKIFFKQTHSIEKGDHVLDILSQIVVPEDTPEVPSDGAGKENDVNNDEEK